MRKPPRNFWLIVIKNPDGSLEYCNWLRPHEFKWMAEEALQNFLPPSNGGEWTIIKYKIEGS